MIENLDEALAVAVRAAEDDGAHRQDHETALLGYVTQLHSEDCADGEGDGDGSTAGFASRLIRLSALLRRISLHDPAVSLIDLARDRLTDAEEQGETVRPDDWNALAVLQAAYGRLDDARDSLGAALDTARTCAPAGPQEVKALTNLAVVSMRTGDVRQAARWAGEAREAADRQGPADEAAQVDTRLLIASVMVGAARAVRGPDRGERLETAVKELERWTRVLLDVAGPDHRRSLEAAATLARAEFDAACAARDTDRAERAVDVLETVTQRISAGLGADHPQTLTALANLAAAEFEAAGLSAPSEERRARAESILETVAQQTSATLGRDHPQTQAALSNLARMRGDSTQVVELVERIDATYTPRNNTQRNHAKSRAIAREKHLVRLIAHAGASYFLDSPQRFMPVIVQALENRVHFHVIVSSPWNNLGVFIKREAAWEKPTAENVIELIEASDYYKRTFRKVIKEYERLRTVYGDRIELRLTPMDISGTTLLTSDAGFFEPYMTANPEDRTQRGMGAFEIEFGKVSRYYALSVDTFETQWELASTLEQFRAHEFQHKQRLRMLLSTLTDDTAAKPVAPPAGEAD
ncbi:hypothetical protein ACIP98_02025 [Streptomyces sp. NPDC088354]|uniref:hypothetical protein n=1 Tax=unclassified Streptomyces TaxID=2593676 RepID=UPI0029A3DC57|nr:hypothetical protein [Streptomyces sp. MI02-7b]MDX3073611.1 hypothetical protein [Streptomyces sp. MI02-7b]